MIRPLNSGVVIEPCDLPEKTEAGIVMTEAARGKSNEGTVVAVGKGHYDPRSGTYIPLDIEVGARVLFLRWSGYAITYNGKQLIRVEESEVLCEVDKEDDVELQGMIVKK